MDRPEEIVRCVWPKPASVSAMASSALEGFANARPGNQPSPIARAEHSLGLHRIRPAPRFGYRQSLAKGACDGPIAGGVVDASNSIARRPAQARPGAGRSTNPRGLHVVFSAQTSAGFFVSPGLPALLCPRRRTIQRVLVYCLGAAVFTNPVFANRVVGNRRARPWRSPQGEPCRTGLRRRRAISRRYKPDLFLACARSCKQTWSASSRRVLFKVCQFQMAHKISFALYFPGRAGKSSFGASSLASREPDLKILQVVGVKLLTCCVVVLSSQPSPDWSCRCAQVAL